MMHKTKQKTPFSDATPSSPGLKRLADLQVRAHVLTLQSGLFCVFQDGDAPADPGSGLPYVKISPRLAKAAAK